MSGKDLKESPFKLFKVFTHFKCIVLGYSVTKLPNTDNVSKNGTLLQLSHFET
jgi:hypothetical protein